MVRTGALLLILVFGIRFISPGIYDDLTGRIVDFKDKVVNVKNTTVDIINPISKEKGLIDSLSMKVKEFNELINSKEFFALSDGEKKEVINSYLNETRNKLNQLSSISKDKNITTTISNLLKKIIPGSFEENPQPTWLPPGTQCP